AEPLPEAGRADGGAEGPRYGDLAVPAGQGPEGGRADRPGAGGEGAADAGRRGREEWAARRGLPAQRFLDRRHRECRAAGEGGRAEELRHLVQPDPQPVGGGGEEDPQTARRG